MSPDALLRVPIFPLAGALLYIAQTGNALHGGGEVCFGPLRDLQNFGQQLQGLQIDPLGRLGRRVQVELLEHHRVIGRRLEAWSDPAHGLLASRPMMSRR